MTGRPNSPIIFFWRRSRTEQNRPSWCHCRNYAVDRHDTSSTKFSLFLRPLTRVPFSRLDGSHQPFPTHKYKSILIFARSFCRVFFSLRQQTTKQMTRNLHPQLGAFHKQYTGRFRAKILCQWLLLTPILTQSFLQQIQGAPDNICLRPKLLFSAGLCRLRDWTIPNCFRCHFLDFQRALVLGSRTTCQSLTSIRTWPTSDNREVEAETSLFATTTKRGYTSILLLFEDRYTTQVCNLSAETLSLQKETFRICASTKKNLTKQSEKFCQEEANSDKQCKPSWQDTLVGEESEIQMFCSPTQRTPNWLLRVWLRLRYIACQKKPSPETVSWSNLH